MATLKKTYLHCSKCNHYTRMRENIYQRWRHLDPLYWLFSPFGFRKAYYFVEFIPEFYNEICENCGNERNLKKLYLDTEVDDRGIEYSYFTPDRIKNEVIRPAVADRLKNNPLMRMTSGVVYYCPQCTLYFRPPKKACPKCNNNNVQRKIVNLLYEKGKYSNLPALRQRNIAFLKPDGELQEIDEGRQNSFDLSQTTGVRKLFSILILIAIAILIVVLTIMFSLGLSDSGGRGYFPT